MAWKKGSASTFLNRDKCLDKSLDNNIKTDICFVIYHFQYYTKLLVTLTITVRHEFHNKPSL